MIGQASRRLRRLRRRRVTPRSPLPAVSALSAAATLLAAAALPTAALLLTLAHLAGCQREGYRPGSGDLVFQTSLSDQGEALRIVTGSRWTHMGIVFVTPDGPQVYEAVGPVKLTPLEEWAGRGEGGRIVARRLRDADARLDAAAVAELRRQCDDLAGRAYDHCFRWDDRELYCSELVWKAYRRALGLELGALQTIAEFDLSDPHVEAVRARRCPEGLPPEQRVITPAAMHASDRLVTVYEGSWR